MTSTLCVGRLCRSRATDGVVVLQLRIALVGCRAHSRREPCSSSRSSNAIAERDAQHPNLRLRVHRALSWLDRAEQADDLDGRFIFLWIAFNAAYATEIDERQRLSEQETFKAFLQKLCSLDESNRIDALVWQEFSGSIRVLLDNPYVFQSFWDHKSGKIDEPTRKPASPAASAPLIWPWPAVTPRRYSVYCLTACIPCAINLSMAAPPERFGQPRADAGLHQLAGQAGAADHRADDG